MSLSFKASVGLACTGRGTAGGSHCCFVDGEVCEFLQDSGVVGDERFHCGLRAELGSWVAVHADLRYQPIGEHFTSVGTALCGDWQPRAEQCCREVRSGDLG
jgi:hypothetical protein